MCRYTGASSSLLRASALKLNYCLEQTGCKSGSAPKKSREESALFVLGEAPVPAAQVSRYNSGF